MRTNGLDKITKWLLILILMMLTVSACSGINHPTTENDQHLEIIRIQGPLPISFALPLISAIEHHALDAYATKIEYKTWKNPDELKARIISNQADIFAVPTYAAANLYNRQLNVNYVATIVWGYLYMIGPEQEPITWDALKEETIYIPHKGHVADLVFQYLARQNGLDPKKDLSVHYVSGPNEAVAQLIMGNAKYAIISEHAATLAVIKGKKEGIALDKVMDLQEEWAKATGKDAEIPIGGILISGKFMQKHPDVVEALTNALNGCPSDTKCHF